MIKNYPTWTARIPPDVKEYLQNKKRLSAGQCLVEYYKILKSQELTELLKELKNAKERVLQLEASVTHLQSECNTQWGICNTVFKQLALQPSFDINNLDENDKLRIKLKLENKGILNITVDQFIDHYRNKEVSNENKV